MERILLNCPGRSDMNKILVPIKDFSAPSLSASYFAIELAKRTSQTRIFFLIFRRPLSGEGKDPKGPAGREGEPSWQKQFETLIHQALSEKMDLEMHHSSDEYVQAVARFVVDHHIGEVIIALPSEEDGLFREIRQDIQKLQGKVECRLVTVRPKEEGGGSPLQR
jgi:hypothetical protein